MRLIFCLIILSVTYNIHSSCAAPSSTVRIGVTLPLTGPIAYIGEDIRRGISLALEEEKQERPVKLEVIYEDNEAQGRKAVTAAHKLIEQSKADILISLWDMADVIAPVAEQYRVPHLSIRWNPHIAVKYKYTFTFESTYKTYVKSQLELLKALNVTSVALATEEGQGWMLASDELKRHAGEFGIKVLADDTFQPGTADFQGIATHLLSKNPQLIVTNMQQPPLEILLKKIRDQGPHQRITGYFEHVDRPIMVEGMPFVAQYALNPAFNQLFQSRYGEKYKARAAHGYDLIKMIAFVYQQAGKKIDADEFVKMLSALKDFKGMTGSLSANGTKSIENVPVWEVSKEGEFIRYTAEMQSQGKF